MADEILLILNNKKKPIIEHYLETVAQGSLQKYRIATQTGIREGQDLYSHLIQGALLLHSLSSLFECSEEETRLIMAAFSIHDLNKLYKLGGKSLRKLADDRTFFEQVIHDSGVAEFLPEWRGVFVDLKQLILGHGAHTTIAGERLLVRVEGSRIDKNRLEALTFLMRAADISDLSKYFEERKFKDKFLLEINSIGARQYRLISHRLGEHRGVLSNIIHNCARDILEKEYAATAVFLYPEGSWYLVPEDAPLPVRALFHQKVSALVQKSLGTVRSQDLSKIVFLTKDGVKIDASAFRLGLSATEIVTAITHQVFRRKFAPHKIEEARQKCDDRLQRKSSLTMEPYCNEHGTRYPVTEDSMRAGELVRALYNLVNTHFAKQAASLTNGAVDAWPSLYTLLGMDGAVFEPFDKLYDRPFVVAGTLGKAYPDLEQTIEGILARLLEIRQEADTPDTPDFLLKYVEETLDIDFAPRPVADLTAYFSSYVTRNHKQCCYSASTGQAESWMSAEVPKGIVVQQFSNRLKGGVKREPKRNICPVCREQFFLEQMLFRSGGTKGMYLHFFPQGGLPAVYMETLRHSLEDLTQKADPDMFFLPTETSLIDGSDTNLELHLLSQKARGFALPKQSEALGNTITLSVCPGVGESSDGKRVLQSVEIGLRLGKLLGLRCVVSESPIPPVGSQQFEAFYIDTMPSALQSFFGERNLTRPQAEALLARYTSLRIVDREVRTGFDSIDWDLARALGIAPLAVYAVADRALERKLRQVSSIRDSSLSRQIRTKISGDLRKLTEGGIKMADEQVLSERIKKMAEVATEYKLWGRNTANRSSLLNPLSTVFKNLRRMSPEMDLAFVKAQTIDDIFAHIGRVRRQTNPRFKIGQTKRNGITVYVEEFYSILEEVYGKKLPRVLTHEKAIEAAYLFFLSESMNVKNIESSEEEVKEAEPESGDIQ